ncbi:MAG: DnaJ domain-containing protein [Candidatus Altiarchaeales archaeon]|nr:DnaJ domain-containing protein [Candidatus Altiarchaeota archaeon]MCG2782076.1 DnaJ domain-containing protein [Candidatus Altiarchaeales archaeon]MBU4266145.1 DnaJ domain-containing protein [Candidatus Altiarchaeota archaeon]MBU4341032.1 DnaJ domain-containing protein [Candidatus Altiarchaeota archaeon]MBU4406949.1 DnaJ domain-containing protein [Candidatus Altiarchaeota archaeon]
MGEEFKHINEARKFIGLGESATLKEIKSTYRKLSKKHHLDMGKESGEKMKEINEAYDALVDYCDSYRFSFKKEGVEDFYSKYMKGFQEGWMWSPVKRGAKDKKEHRGF